MQNNSENLVIEINNNFYTLKINDFENEEINISEHLKPDYSNIIGDLLTFPVFLNQIANLKSSTETVVSRLKLELDIKKASLEKELKQSRLGAKTTVAETENYIMLNEDFQALSKQLIERQYQQKILENFYWQGQTKMDVLLKISDKIQPNEFNMDLLEGSINKVLIKKANTKL